MTDTLPATLADTDLATLFSPKTPEKMGRIVDEIREVVTTFEHDMKNQTSRARTASLAARVRRSKTLLDDAGKEAKAKAQAEVNRVDGVRKAMRDEMDEIAKAAREPLDEWEQAEEARVDAHQKVLSQLRVLGRNTTGYPDDGSLTCLDNSIKSFKMSLDQVAEIDPSTLEEFAEDGAAAKEWASEKLTSQIDGLKVTRQQREDFLKLKAEREADEARRAEEEVKLAEERAAAEAERAALQARLDKAERQAREEREARERAEQAERDRILREKKEEERAAAARSLAEKAEEEREIQVAADVKAEKAKNKAAAEAVAVILRETKVAAPVKTAEAIVGEIRAGSIPHVEWVG